MLLPAQSEQRQAGVAWRPWALEAGGVRRGSAQWEGGCANCSRLQHAPRPAALPRGVTHLAEMPALRNTQMAVIKSAFNSETTNSRGGGTTHGYTPLCVFKQKCLPGQRGSRPALNTWTPAQTRRGALCIAGAALRTSLRRRPCLYATAKTSPKKTLRSGCLRAHSSRSRIQQPN